MNPLTYYATEYFFISAETDETGAEELEHSSSHIIAEEAEDEAEDGDDDGGGGGSKRPCPDAASPSGSASDSPSAMEASRSTSGSVHQVSTG